MKLTFLQTAIKEMIVIKNHRPILHVTSKTPPPTHQQDGNLYYVRLKTPLGLFYKLGFTTMDSVEKRLAFQGKGHEKYIDEVLIFIGSSNAFDEEQALHEHFRHQAPFNSPDPLMPFYENGQSELYVDDILGLDRKFTETQAMETRRNIVEQRLKRFGNEGEVYVPSAAVKKTEENSGLIGLIYKLIVRLFGLLLDACDKVSELNASKSEKEKKARAEKLLIWLRDEQAFERARRKRELDRKIAAHLT